MPPVAAVGAIAKRRRIVRCFERAGALSPQTAQTLAEIGVTHGLAVRRMINGGVIKAVPGYCFWLDEAANAAFRRRARISLAVALGLQPS